MKIHIYQETGLEENYIDLHYDEMDQQTEIAYEFLSGFQNTIIGKKRDDELSKMILPSEILYVEIVDRKTFLYLADSEWQTNQNLTSILEQFEGQGFVRIGKATVVNVYHIKELKADYNMRVYLILDNDEKIILSRAYRSSFYEYLQKTREGMQ